MPQDIPLEAGEELAFTPPALLKASPRPAFTLCTPTPRHKRARRKLLRQEGVASHSVEALREEMLTGLRAQWSKDICDKHLPVLEAYWHAFDDFMLQAKDDPDLKWTYDEEIERGVNKLEREVRASWRPLARMVADNAEFQDVAMLSIVAVSVIDWTGLKATAEFEAGHLTIDAVDAMRDALNKVEMTAGVEAGTAWGQLLAECMKRMFLDEETEGNSASPSPSEPPPPSSSKSTGRGRSKASANSSAIPATE